MLMREGKTGVTAIGAKVPLLDFEECAVGCLVREPERRDFLHLAPRVRYRDGHILLAVKADREPDHLLAVDADPQDVLFALCGGLTARHAHHRKGRHILGFLEGGYHATAILRRGKSQPALPRLARLGEGVRPRGFPFPIRAERRRLGEFEDLRILHAEAEPAEQEKEDYSSAEPVHARAPNHCSRARANARARCDSVALTSAGNDANDCAYPSGTKSGS